MSFGSKSPPPLVIAVLCLSACAPPPPNSLERYVAEKCQLRDFEAVGFGCKKVNWACVGAEREVYTYEC